jgi:glycine hydroxymethyltransferase
VQLANWIADVLGDLGNEAVITRVRNQVLDICRKFPVYAKEM